MAEIWHVRNKDNIERVRRDEENARKEEEERLRKVALAESEVKIGLLRERAKQKQRDDGVVYEDTTTQATTSRHINFFSDEEHGIKKGGSNVEHEAEKKEEKEKQEKAIGLLTYLGQSAVEGQTVKPWYYTAPTKQHEQTAHSQREECDKKKKSAADPMKLMMTYMNAKRKVEGKAPEPPNKRVKSEPCVKKEARKSLHSDSDSSDSEAGKSKSKHKKKKHKHKKKHKKHKEKKSHKDGSPKNNKSQSSGQTIDQLRAERLKRELAERQKTKQLFASLRGEKTQEERELEKKMDDRTRGYNSQFNPEFTRKPKKKKEWLNMVQ